MDTLDTLARDFSQATPRSKSEIRERIGDYAEQAYDKGREEGIQKCLKTVKDWEYSLTNYMTQMQSQRSYETGKLVTEISATLKEKLYALLANIKP